MPTLVPRTPATPRRLFLAPLSPKPLYRGPLRAAMARGAKRRRLGTVRRARTVREIVQDIAQEKKRQERVQAISTPHVLNTYLVGSEIAPGVGSWQRVGGHITLTGISIKGNYTNSANRVGTNVTVPTTLRIWIVSTSRNDSPLAYWYQNFNADGNLNYNTDFAQTPAGDVVRSQARLNAQEIKVHARKSIKVLPGRDTQQNNGACRNFSMFHKFKKPMVIKYNTGAGEAVPYSANQVQPNIWICFAIVQPDVLATAGQTASQGNMAFTMYYRE